MEIGLSVYDIDPVELVALARSAEEAGFGTIWLGEHVVLPVDYRTEHPTTGTNVNESHRAKIIDPDTKLLDPLIAFGAVAAVTTRIRLATGIYLLPLRHPLAVARMTLTLQGLAAGRFMLGVGSGWLEEEFDALGVPFAERGARFDESITVLRAAWAGGEIDGGGPHYPFPRVLATEEAVRVPLVLGGNTDRALRRAARLADGWFSSGNPTFDEAVRLRARLGELCADAGREQPLPVYVRMAGRDPEALARYAAAGFEHVTVWANQLWPDDGDLGSKRDRFLDAAAAVVAA
ncbi:MAG: TIGR03619 family F420-dependent LLM class oxidoreductase [Ilumatobacteraceae bacterium]